MFGNHRHAGEQRNQFGLSIGARFLEERFRLRPDRSRGDPGSLGDLVETFTAEQATRQAGFTTCQPEHLS
jgi:hypothetical protein